jgi:hypothetical protein
VTHGGAGHPAAVVEKDVETPIESPEHSSVLIPSDVGDLSLKFEMVTVVEVDDNFFGQHQREKS